LYLLYSELWMNSRPPARRANALSALLPCEQKRFLSNNTTKQLNVPMPSLQKHGRLCITVSVNIWDNSYEEKAQLNRCDLSARLKAG